MTALSYMPVVGDSVDEEKRIQAHQIWLIA